jgi:hypothetical protein
MNSSYSSALRQTKPRVLVSTKPENDPSARTQTELLCKPIRRIKEEKSMTRNHGGGIIGRGIIKKEPLRREVSGRHLGGIWDARMEVRSPSTVNYEVK